MSAHFICILINSTRNGIVARPRFMASAVSSPAYFPCIPPPAVPPVAFLRRSFLPLVRARLYVQLFAVYIWFSVLVSFATLIYGSCF